MSHKQMIQVKLIQDEESKIVKQTVQVLQAENYTMARLLKMQERCIYYEKSHGGSRANRCLLSAVRFLLTQLV